MLEKFWGFSESGTLRILDIVGRNLPTLCVRRRRRIFIVCVTFTDQLLRLGISYTLKVVVYGRDFPHCLTSCEVFRVGISLRFSSGKTNMVGFSLREIPYGRIFTKWNSPPLRLFTTMFWPDPGGVHRIMGSQRWGFHEPLWPHPGDARRGVC